MRDVKLGTRNAERQISCILLNGHQTELWARFKAWDQECKAYPMAGCIQCSQVPQPTCNWKWHSWQLGNLTTSKGFKAWDQECEAYPVAGCIQCWPTPIWYLPRSLDEMEVHENNFNFLPLFIELKVLSPQQFHLWLQPVTQEENNPKHGP